MKIQSNIISIDIHADEWKKIQKEWESVIYGDSKQNPSYSTTPFLYKFLNHIATVAQNPSHTIEENL